MMTVTRGDIAAIVSRPQTGEHKLITDLHRYKMVRRNWAEKVCGSPCERGRSGRLTMTSHTGHAQLPQRIPAAAADDAPRRTGKPLISSTERPLTALAPA